MLADELVELADAPLPGGEDPIRLKAETERRRLQIDARKWAAGKFNRLLYSDDPNRTNVLVNINHDDAGAVSMQRIQERLARKGEARQQQKAEAVTIDAVPVKKSDAE